MNEYLLNNLPINTDLLLNDSILVLSYFHPNAKNVQILTFSLQLRSWSRQYYQLYHR